MKLHRNPSRAVNKAIEQFKRQEITRKELIKVLKHYPDHPIGDLVPEYHREEQQKLIANGKIPNGAIIANLDKQEPNGSYDCKAYYVDETFRCVDCGIEHTWTAEQQQHWFEVVKGSIYTQITRCRDCDRTHKKEKQAQQNK